MQVKPPCIKEIQEINEEDKVLIDNGYLVDNDENIRKLKILCLDVNNNK